MTPGRSIIIDFEGHNGKNSSIYFLFETKILELNDETRMVKFAQTLPNTPPSNQQFEAWVYQSINKSAQNFYNSIFKEVYNASLIGSTYLTTSPFVSKLISRDLSKTHTFESDVANLVLSLDLPVIKNASIEKIMDVRNNDGEAFKNFRVQLRKQVRELRGINDPNSLKYKLENISHELNEVQVYEVNKKFRQVKKDLFIDLGAFIVSLSTTLPTSGLSLLGGVGSLIKGYKDYTTYATKVKENPGYFLWKIKGKNIY